MTWPILLRKNVAPQHREDAKCRKQTRGNPKTIQRLRWSGGVTRQIENSVAVNPYGFQRACASDQLLSVVPEDPISAGPLGVREIGADLYEFSGTGVGQRIDKDGLDCGENYCRRADAQRNG